MIDFLDWSEMKVATTVFEDVFKTSSIRRHQDFIKKS